MNLRGVAKQAQASAAFQFSPNFGAFFKGEVRRIPILRCWMNCSGLDSSPIHSVPLLCHVGKTIGDTRGGPGMRRRGLGAACVVLLLLGVGVLVVGAGFAKDDDAVAKCSEATLHGTYLVAHNGFEIQGNDKVPFAVAGYEVYDGSGKVNGVYTVNSNGQVFPFKPKGSYTVNPNCTGSNALKTDG